MMRIHKKFEAGLAKFTALVYRRENTALIFALLITVALAAQILEIDTRDESFFHKSGGRVEYVTSEFQGRH